MTTVKFLCSYGGRIIPRYTDSKLRYHGGHTRVISVQRSISFAELAMKLGEICGTKVTSLRCQLPTDDLDALVTVSSDEDLTNLMEEYDLATTAASLKIHVFLSPPLKPAKTSSSPAMSSSSSSSSNSSTSRSRSPPSPSTVDQETCPICVERSHHRNTNKGCYVRRVQSHDQLYLIRN